MPAIHQLALPKYYRKFLVILVCTLFNEWKTPYQIHALYLSHSTCKKKILLLDTYICQLQRIRLSLMHKLDRILPYFQLWIGFRLDISQTGRFAMLYISYRGVMSYFWNSSTYCSFKHSHFMLVTSNRIAHNLTGSFMQTKKHCDFPCLFYAIPCSICMFVLNTIVGVKIDDRILVIQASRLPTNVITFSQNFLVFHITAFFFIHSEVVSRSSKRFQFAFDISHIYLPLI